MIIRRSIHQIFLFLNRIKSRLLLFGAKWAVAASSIGGSRDTSSAGLAAANNRFGELKHGETVGVQL